MPTEIIFKNPPQVADWLMKEGHTDDDDLDMDSETGSMMRKISSPRSSNQGDIRQVGAFLNFAPYRSVFGQRRSKVVAFVGGKNNIWLVFLDSV